MPRPNAPFQRKDGLWQTKIRGKTIYGKTKAEILGKLAKAQRASTPLKGVVKGVPSTIAEAAALFREGHPSDFTRCCLEWFIQFAGGLGLDEIYDLGDGVHAESLLTDYLRWLKTKEVKTGKFGKPHPMSRKTITSYLSYATSLLRFCRTRWNSVMPSDPPLNERPKPVSNPKGLSENELQLVFAELAKDKRRNLATAVMRFISVTGCRPSEACGLQWEWAQGSPVTCFILPQHKTDRTGDPRVIPVTDATRPLLPPQQASGPVFVNHAGRAYKANGLRSIVRRVAKKALGREIGTYTLRHTFAQIGRPHMSLDQLKVVMGHKDIATTMKYFRPDNQDVRDVLESLPLAQIVQPPSAASAASAHPSSAAEHPAPPKNRRRRANDRDQADAAGQG